MKFWLLCSIPEFHWTILGDSLFTPLERPKGLPIGNQTSQFFSNVYLSPMDHFIKENLKTKGYIRYVDDFLLFDRKKSRLWECRNELEKFLFNYRLSLKPNGVNRVNLFRVKDGFPFLGYRVFPNATLVRKEAILRFRRKTKKLRILRRKQKADIEDIRQYVFGVMGHFSQADSSRLKKKLLDEAWF
ncbi:MAG: RNA-directed DNA polymerase [Desulfobacteraceae bacterium]|nr:RNA-directed DNA polymerase [Desulfobacteraceae bacterium]